MNETMRLEVQEEIRKYMEEVKEKDTERRLQEIEKETAVIHYLFGGVSFLLALIFAKMFGSPLSYFVFFAPFFVVSLLIGIKLIKSNLAPIPKRHWIVVPIALYVCSLIAPMAFQVYL